MKTQLSMSTLNRNMITPPNEKIALKLKKLDALQNRKFASRQKKGNL